MRQVWESKDGEVWTTERDALEHEKRVDTRVEISNWVNGRVWADEAQAKWLITVLQNDYFELREFLITLP